MMVINKPAKWWVFSLQLKMNWSEDTRIKASSCPFVVFFLVCSHYFRKTTIWQLQPYSSNIIKYIPWNPGIYYFQCFGYCCGFPLMFFHSWLLVVCTFSESFGCITKWFLHRVHSNTSLRGRVCILEDFQIL